MIRRCSDVKQMQRPDHAPSECTSLTAGAFGPILDDPRASSKFPRQRSADPHGLLPRSYVFHSNACASQLCLKVSCYLKILGGLLIHFRRREIASEM
jgi:hypothetical protein